MFDHGFDAGMVSAEDVVALMVVAGQVVGGGLEALAALDLDLAGPFAVTWVQRLEASGDFHLLGPAVGEGQQAGQISHVRSGADLVVGSDGG
ncbi:hypothetical protein [Nonomuraea glycinis]|uniref:hypothetical protein n=1 Tax=Nonomuraea glycinis TaxID=2047744 RepID=UPI0033ABF5FD